MSTRGCGGDCCRAAPKAWRATPGCASHRWGDRRCGGVQVPAALKVQDGHRNIRNVPDVSVHLNLEISAPIYCKLANCCVEIFRLEVGRGGGRPSHLKPGRRHRRSRTWQRPAPRGASTVAGSATLPDIPAFLARRGRQQIYVARSPGDRARQFHSCQSLWHGFGNESRAGARRTCPH
jgi:hypothetical protein